MSTISDFSAAGNLAQPANDVGFLRKLLSAPGRALRAVVAEYRLRRQYSRTVAALAELDDRTLADIGLDRSEIPAAAARDWVGDADTTTGLWPHDAIRPANANNRRAAA